MYVSRYEAWCDHAAAALPSRGVTWGQRRGEDEGGKDEGRVESGECKYANKVGRYTIQTFRYTRLLK